MLWQHSRSLFYATQKWKILRSFSLRFTTSSSPAMLLAAISEKTHKTHKHSPEYLGQYPYLLKELKFTFTPEIVHSTLLNCPSDLIALSFFLWFAKRPNYFHDNQGFAYMVPVVTRLTRRYKSVKGILRQLDSVRCITKAQTFLLLLEIFWRGEIYDMFFEVVDEMESYGFTPNTKVRNMIMDVLFKIGYVDAGLKVLEEIPFPNFLSFDLALRNLCMLNDLFNIRRVVRDMLQQGYYPNVISFEKILKCFCKMSRLPEAQQVLGVMITLGISFSEAAWSTVINLFCRLHQIGTAGSLLQKMVETGCSPNVVTYTVLIKGYMDSQMVTYAFNILSKMLAEGHVPDLILCNVLIHCLCKSRRYDDALDVFIGLLEHELVPDSYTFCSLLSAICLSKRFTLLKKLVAGFVVVADNVVCNSLLSYCCKAGLPSLAADLCVEMFKRGFTLDKYSFVGLINGLCGARRIDEAVNVYLEIVKIHSNLDPHVHTVIMSGLIKVGKYHRAIKLFRRAIDENYPLDAVSYMVAIVGLVKGKRGGEAASLYNQMKGLNMSPDAYTYSVLLSFFCEERNIQMVEQLFEEITQAGIELEYKTVVRVSKFLCKYHTNSAALTQLIEM